MASRTIALLFVMLATVAGFARADAGKPAVVKQAPMPKPVMAAEVMNLVKASKAKATLVNVWATWCVPCRQEMPDLLQVRSELAARGFRLILVSADFDAALPDTVKFLGERGVDFETYQKRQSDQDFIAGLDPTWSGALPVSMIFDSNGKLVESLEGRLLHETLIKRLTPLLDAKGDSK